MTNYNNIPEELKELRQWVGFSIFERENGKRGKMPINPRTNRPAAANKPETWGTFDQAYNAIGEPATYSVNGVTHRGTIDGIGIEFDQNIFGLDLDGHVIGGELTPEAKDIIKTMNSYTELSPSGTGVHILAYGALPPGSRRNDRIGLEMYDSGRFFTVTGNALINENKIMQRTKEAAEVHEKYMKPQGEGRGTSSEPQKSSLSNVEILARMFGSKNGKELERLYNGDMGAYDDDHSAADFALIGHLAYWTNGDAAKMDDLFRDSGLMREKWDRAQSGSTYGNITIDRVLKNFSPYNDTKPITKINGVEIGKKQPSERFSKSGEDLPADNKESELAPIESAHDYFKNSFKLDNDKFKNARERKTGFKNLDEHGNLYPGLYVIGALSSLGKTTFTHQLADQLAEQGETVLFFSLEQSMFEIGTKSIAREAFKLSPSNRSELASAIEIRSGKRSKTINTAYKNYMKFNANVYIQECNFETTFDSIKETVEEFIKEKGISPVVIVDYLQIIPSIEPRLSDKEKADRHVRGFKVLQRNHDLTVFLISSVNRANYLTPISFESFKESGGIEYTADVIWGLQYHCLNDPLFTTDGKSNTTAKRREAINKAKRQVPRQIQLVCLKNRFGQDFSINFDYYAQYDYFEPLRVFKRIQSEDGEAATQDDSSTLKLI